MIDSRKKKYLGRAFWLKENVKTKYEEIEELRAIAEKCTASITGMPGAHNADDKLGNIVAKIVDKENEIGKYATKQLTEYSEIERCINAVESLKHREILEQRYLAYKSWEEIAQRLNYSKQYVIKVHEEALKMVHIPNQH